MNGFHQTKSRLFNGRKGVGKLSRKRNSGEILARAKLVDEGFQHGEEIDRSAE